MTIPVTINRSDRYEVVIDGDTYFFTTADLRRLRTRIDAVLKGLTEDWPIGKQFTAEAGAEPRRDVWLRDNAGDIAGWIEAHESTNGREGWTWVEWSDGHRSTALHTDPWDTFTVGSVFTVVAAK